MSRNDPIGFALRCSPILAVIGAIIVGLKISVPGAIGFSTGAALSIGSLAVGRFLLYMRKDQDPKGNIQRLQLLLLAKMPFLGLVVYLVNRLGIVADECFLVGYLLVYFGLVMGAILGRSAPANFDEVA